MLAELFQRFIDGLGIPTEWANCCPNFLSKRLHHKMALLQRFESSWWLMECWRDDFIKW